MYKYLLGFLLISGTTITNAAQLNSVIASPNIQFKVITSSQVAPSTTNYVATPLTVTITPNSLTSKIKLQTVLTFITTTGSTAKRAIATIYRDGIDLDTSGTFEGLGNCISDVSTIPCSISFSVLDTPNSLAAHTYTVEYRDDNTSATFNTKLKIVSLIAEEVR